MWTRATIAILWVISLAAHATTQPATFQQLVKQAETARKADQLPDAITLYHQALALRPQWSEGWWWLGSIYYDQNLYPEAHSAFEKSVAGSKQSPIAYAYLGLCDYELRDYTAARLHIGKWFLAGSPGDQQLTSVSRFRWEELLIQEGHFVEALVLLNKDVGAHGTNPWRSEAMGLAWLQMKDVPEAYPPEKREMVWLAGSAAAWMSANKMDRSKESLARLDSRYGDQPYVHFLHGFVEESMKNTDAAIKDYNQELQVAPEEVAPLIQLALLYVDAGRKDEAVAAAQQAVSREPDNARSHYALGRAFFSAKNWPSSAAEFETAKTLSPHSSKLSFHLAKAYRKMGRIQDAEREEAAFDAEKSREEGNPPVDNPEQPVQKSKERAH